MNKIRKSAVSGVFYPSGKNELIEKIKSFCDNKNKNEIISAIVPHAGYDFSGKIACRVFSAMKSNPEVFVILGTNHTGVESGFAVSTSDYETPLGIVKNDLELSKLLIDNSKNKRFNVGETSGDKFAEKTEHSIEVQIPFLQYFFKDFKIVPIICRQNSYENYLEFAKYLSESLKKLGRKAVIISSSDFTHYGRSFDFVPFSENIKENIYALDKKAIELILNFKTRDFLKYAEKTTICGSATIAVCLEISKTLGVKKARLVDYLTSGEVTNDWKNVVSYAGITFSV